MYHKEAFLLRVLGRIVRWGRDAEDIQLRKQPSTWLGVDNCCLVAGVLKLNEESIISHLQASYSGVSKSVLRFTPTMEDDGRYLTCRAENEALHNAVMEDQWELQVHCEYMHST